MIACDEERATRVGRVGELDLHYIRRGRETILTRFKCSSPWHLLPPIALDDTGCACTWLLNPSGGLVGGDRLSVRATLGPRSHVLFSTPSANRVYRSKSEASSQSVDLHVGTGAVLEWMPDLTIPFAGSRFHQRIHVQLEPGATVLLWDAIASGRVRRGERWAFTRLDNEIRITAASGKAVLDRYELGSPEKNEGMSSGPALVEKWDYVASLYVVNDLLDTEVWKRLEQNLVEVLDDRPGHLFGGVSEPSVPGLVIKLVASSAPHLYTTLDRLWAAVRGNLWALPVPALRRY